nr:MAG TPA: Encapsidation protein fold, VIRAL PROTEIN [Bacteriophage sp.]
MTEAEFKRRREAIRNKKTYKGDWYSVNSIFGNDWALFYCLLGGREAGKSYSAMRWGVNNKLKKGD